MKSANEAVQSMLSPYFKKEFSDKSSKDILKLLKEKNNSKLYPSRIFNLGMYIIISNSKDFKDKNESEINKTISETFEKLGLSFEKAEKDTDKIIAETKLIIVFIIIPPFNTYILKNFRTTSS